MSADDLDADKIIDAVDLRLVPFSTGWDALDGLDTPRRRAAREAIADAINARELS